MALTTHVTPTSQIVAAAVRMLRAHSPGVQLIVSYADPQQGHRGAIYQAMNWLYVGTSRPQAQLIVDGTPMHKKTAFSAFGTASTKTLQARGIDAVRGPIEWKHKYLLPLTRAMRKRLLPTALPYPKT